MLPLRLSRLGGGEEQPGMGGTTIQKASARHGQWGISSLHWVLNTFDPKIIYSSDGRSGEIRHALLQGVTTNLRYTDWVMRTESSKGQKRFPRHRNFLAMYWKRICSEAWTVPWPLPLEPPGYSTTGSKLYTLKMHCWPSCYCRRPCSEW